jgi:hypothetical protein
MSRSRNFDYDFVVIAKIALRLPRRALRAFSTLTPG